MEKLWNALEIVPLTAEQGVSKLRIWDERSSLTISSRGDTVSVSIIRGQGEAWLSIVDEHDGHGKRLPNAEQALKTTKTTFSFRDAKFAREIHELVSCASRFDADEMGIDGSYTNVDAVDLDGKASTFELWSADPEKYPWAAEACDLLDTFQELAALLDSSEEDWRNRAKWNFKTRFPEFPIVKMTRAEARGYVESALKKRLTNLVAALRDSARAGR